MTNVLALVIASVVLVLIPGPNVALIVANSLRHGLKFGLVTAFGTTAGLALQLVLVIAGMAAAIAIAATTLLWIKWLGVAYLVYLGIRTWRERPDDLSRIGAQSKSGTFWRAFGLAVVNPKTLLFNAAFLPQFVRVDAGAAELWLLAAVYLAVVVAGDALWAVFAASARRCLGRFGQLRNRVTGGLLLGAGVSLALSRRSG